jgi:starch synthase
MVSRLTEQKGANLIAELLPTFRERDMQLAVLGTGDFAFEHAIGDFAYNNKDRFAARITFNEPLSRRFYAGADVFLMPSQFEPCGLAQMMASRYGTVPVVRETGGLADTIHPYNPTTGEGNGINFVSYNAHHMLDALRRAVELYNKPEQWARLRHNAMTYDFSWSKSAKLYLEMYSSLF